MTDFSTGASVSDSATDPDFQVGQEPYLKHEVVCPVTHLTYHRDLPTSPHLGPDGIPY